MVIVTPNKTNFKTKDIISDTEEDLLKINGSIYQEDITIINIHALKLNKIVTREPPKQIK